MAAGGEIKDDPARQALIGGCRWETSRLTGWFRSGVGLCASRRDLHCSANHLFLASLSVDPLDFLYFPELNSRQEGQGV